MSPYSGRPEDEWLDITHELVKRHPFNLKSILDASLSAWNTLWKTTVGAGPTSVALTDLNVPATVIGYFFEVILAAELALLYPDHWRGSQSKAEKDLVYLPDQSYSVEVKTSGQSGYRIFGNRSYAQRAERIDRVQKEKSGYYLTVNFFGQTLTMLRFGWIDEDDWMPQAAPTGQMAGLPDTVYKYKLIAIPGKYRANAPVGFLRGVGPKTAQWLGERGISTIEQFQKSAADLPEKLTRILKANEEFLASCTDSLE